MSMMRYFFLSINVLNGLLVAAVAAGVFFVVIPHLNQPIMSLPQAKETVELSGEKAPPFQSSSPTDYTVISEQNLFHPERKIPPDKLQEKAIPKPELFLNGTLILDGTSIAFVEDRKAPYSTAGRGKRQITLKKGDSLSGYILSEIEANRIVLVKGEEKLVVMLDDRQKTRTVEQASALPATPRAMSDNASSFQPGMSPSSQTASSPARTATMPAPGIAASGSQQLPQTAQSPVEDAAASSQRPGISRGSGIWPRNRSSIEQTQQKVRE